MIRFIIFTRNIWSSSYVCDIGRIERVQGKFVKYILWKFNFAVENIDYNIRRQLSGLQSLEHR